MAIVDAVSTHRSYACPMSNQSNQPTTTQQTLLIRYWFEKESGCWRILVRILGEEDRLFTNFPELIVFLGEKIAQNSEA